MDDVDSECPHSMSAKHMAKTRTGGFPIGIRLSASLSARPITETAAWVKEQGFACVDLSAPDACETAEAWRGEGLEMGTMDLFAREWPGMLSADQGHRAETVERAIASIRAIASTGCRIVFCVMLAEDVALARRQTFDYMVESYGQLGDTLRETGLRMAIEGWPGCNAQCCNPESYRAFLRAMDSSCYGINFDPSHLLRMGIDPLRFIKEFAPQVFHVHGKDTWIDTERLYNIGHEQAGVFAEDYAWGGTTWRYTVPGRGGSSWPEILAELEAVRYSGYVSIELEDADYNGTLEGERRGFIAARDFLVTV